MGNDMIKGCALNDADYKVTRYIGNKCVWRCPYYMKWVSMITRCYSSNYLQLNPSYVDCTVCDEWLLFSNFKSWMEKQDWKGKELDKDLLGDGKLYSPETCCFVSDKVNNFLRDRKGARGDMMLGVYCRPDNGLSCYRAQCNAPLGEGYKKNIGHFKTELQAHKAWQAKKHEYACMLADLQEDERVAKALRERYAPDKDWTDK